MVLLADADLALLPPEATIGRASKCAIRDLIAKSNEKHNFTLLLLKTRSKLLRTKLVSSS
jgi:hypothetical protein